MVVFEAIDALVCAQCPRELDLSFYVPGLVGFGTQIFETLSRNPAG